MQPPVALPHIRGPADFAAAFAVPREAVEKLELYADLLRQWQRAVNLVAPSTLDDVWHRHFADSAQLLAHQSKRRLQPEFGKIDAQQKKLSAQTHEGSECVGALAHAPNVKIWVDLGSGGGFPGLVIAILLANHENQFVHLIESNGRKCAFLSEVARHTGAAVEIHEGRIENFARGGQIGPADVVTSRALAPLKLLLHLAHGFFSERTLGLFLKGRDARQEIGEALSQWRFEFGCAPSRTSGEGMIVEVRKLASEEESSRSGS